VTRSHRDVPQTAPEAQKTLIEQYLSLSGLVDRPSGVDVSWAQECARGVRPVAVASPAADSPAADDGRRCARPARSRRPFRGAAAERHDPPLAVSSRQHDGRASVPAHPRRCIGPKVRARASPEEPRPPGRRDRVASSVPGVSRPGRRAGGRCARAVGEDGKVGRTRASGLQRRRASAVHGQGSRSLERWSRVRESRTRRRQEPTRESRCVRPGELCSPVGREAARRPVANRFWCARCRGRARSGTPHLGIREPRSRLCTTRS
jgi:hypothetical protein